MADAIAARKPRRKESARKLDPIRACFAHQSPETKTGRDGVVYTLFDRYGAAGGAFTNKDLRDIIGLTTKLDLEKKHLARTERSSKKLEILMKEREKLASSELNLAVARTKRAVARDYRTQGLKPLISMAKMHQDDEARLAIWGFQNRKGELVIGNRNEGAIWTISMLSASNGIANANRRARLLGESLIAQGISSEYKKALTPLLEAPKK